MTLISEMIKIKSDEDGIIFVNCNLETVALYLGSKPKKVLCIHYDESVQRSIYDTVSILPVKSAFETFSVYADSDDGRTFDSFHKQNQINLDMTTYNHIVVNEAVVPDLIASGFTRVLQTYKNIKTFQVRSTYDLYSTVKSKLDDVLNACGFQATTALYDEVHKKYTLVYEQKQ